MEHQTIEDLTMESTFNPMNLEDYYDEEYCKKRGSPELKKLAQSNFCQQNMNCWRPIPTLAYTIGIFAIIFIVCLAFGLSILLLSKNVVEITQRYDDQCGTSTPCTVTITVDEKMSGPVYFYYKLENFHQNHRIYLNSYSLEQLRGEDLEKDELDDCDPVYSVTDIGYSTDPSNTGDAIAHYNTLKSTHPVAFPCGLIAKSFFNDTYKLKNSASTQIAINEKDIAWEDDKSFFKNVDLSKQWINVENEHFIVWMHPSGLSTFRKLWGRIEQDLEAGTYSIEINNNYDMRKFDGKKSVILSTTNALGGKHLIMGWLFIGVAGMDLILCSVFLICYFTKSKTNSQ